MNERGRPGSGPQAQRELGSESRDRTRARCRSTAERRAGAFSQTGRAGTPQGGSRGNEDTANVRRRRSGGAMRC